MQIQITTDNHITGSAALKDDLSAIVSGALGRFGDQLIRVEIHVSDVNGEKVGDRDIRCVAEARLAGLDPIVVTNDADIVRQAVDGAVNRLERQLDRRLEKIGAKKGRISYAGKLEE
jgi:ribosome-associated translation inhibitor RaiA